MRQWISFHSLVKDRYILTRDNQVGKGQQGENLQLEIKNKQPKLVTYRCWVKNFGFLQMIIQGEYLYTGPNSNTR